MHSCSSCGEGGSLGVFTVNFFNSSAHLKIFIVRQKKILGEARLKNCPQAMVRLLEGARLFLRVSHGSSRILLWDRVREEAIHDSSASCRQTFLILFLE